MSNVSCGFCSLKEGKDVKVERKMEKMLITSNGNSFERAGLCFVSNCERNKLRQGFT